MKICFLVGDINRTGGTERVSLLIANELIKKYDVTILSFNNGMNPIFECNEKIELCSLHLEDSNGFFSRKIKPYTRLKKFLKTNPQDVLINVDVILALYSLPMKLFSKIKIISWEHFNFRINNGAKNRDKARKLSAKYADYIVVLTEADKNEYKRNLKIKCPIIHIYNPIVGDIIKKENFEKIVLAIGHFNYSKNFQELVRIWQKVSVNNDDWKLVICGMGNEFEEVKKMIEDLNIKSIILPGFCKNIAEYYKKASIFAMTSRNEGFPMVLLEAQQYSIPLIAYDCFTGPSEIIEDNKNGYLIEYGNREEYVSKLNNLMNDIDKLKIFSNNSFEMVKKYDINNIICEWYKILENINRKSD